MRRVLWPLHHPLVAIVCLAVITLSVVNLPRTGSGTYPIIERLRGTSIHRGTRSHLLYLVRNFDDPGIRPIAPLVGQTGSTAAARFHPLDLDDESADAFSRIIVDRPVDVIEAETGMTLTHRGLWYPVHEETMRVFALVPLGTHHRLPHGFQQADASLNMEDARASFVAWLGGPTQGNDAEAAAFVARGQSAEVISRLRPAALAVNAATLAALLIFAFSVYGMPRYLRVARARRRLRQGRCGVCRYDLRASAARSLTCPECGSVWDRLELAAVLGK